MIIDACAFIGQHPFARSLNHSVDDLLRLMDKAGIERAVVTPLQGAFYQNAQEANEEVHAEIAKHSDRLMLVAAINPIYPGWESDLTRSHRELSAYGIRIFPSYHSYDPLTDEASGMVQKAGELNLPVFIQVRLWDERQHPPVCMVPAVPVSKIAELANAHPKTRFIMSMGRYGEIASALKQNKAGNLYADVAGVQGPTNCMKKLVADVGASRLLFGTEMMLQYALPARYKVDYSGISDQDRRRLYAQNITLLLPGE